jgi:type IV secretion system protein VirB6
MKKLFNKFILLIIPVVLIFSITIAKADTFGETCTVLPLSDSSNYLVNDTAYGYIKNNIDMKTHVEDACKAEGTEFKFCIRNQQTSPDVCTGVIMNIGDKASLESLTSNPDIITNPSLANIQLSVSVVENKVCLTMPTSRGMMPVFCRDKEPTGAVGEDVEEICRTLGRSCYDGSNKSQSLLSFSGLTIHCLRDTLNKVFYIGNECPAFEESITHTMLRPFPEFQKLMKLAVSAALTIYVMFFGFKIVLNSEYLQLNKIAIFVIQIIFVLYFAVGLGAKKIEYGQEVQSNGVTELVLPLLSEMTSNFAEFIFMAGGSQGLCNFDKSKYKKGYEFYKLWDAIDCRIGYYLGMQILYNFGPLIKDLNSTLGDNNVDSEEIEWGEKGDEGPDALEDSTSFSFFTILFGFFMSGYFLIVIMGLAFVIVFISIIMYFLGAYMVCMVTLYVMAYISPIFIPMVLFERTKEYFNSWLRIVVSCTLQPAVIAGFIAILLTMYDSALYGNCEYQRRDYSLGEFNFSTFELRLPTVDPKNCEESTGYKLAKYAQGQGWEKKIVILFQIISINDFLDLSLSLLYLMLYVIIFYFFIKSVNQFASDLVGGPSLASATVSPTMVMDKIKSMASGSGSKAQPAGQNGESKGGKDDVSSGSPDGDSSSTQRGGASDKVSTGGAGAKD